VISEVKKNISKISLLRSVPVRRYAVGMEMTNKLKGKKARNFAFPFLVFIFYFLFFLVHYENSVPGTTAFSSATGVCANPCCQYENPALLTIVAKKAGYSLLGNIIFPQAYPV